MVTEPKVTNAGQPQGAFLKRQMVVKQDGSQEPFLPRDFGIGTDISIFGRIMRIYDCDDYTRQFFAVSDPKCQTLVLICDSCNALLKLVCHFEPIDNASAGTYLSCYSFCTVTVAYCILVHLGSFCFDLNQRA